MAKTINEVLREYFDNEYDPEDDIREMGGQSVPVRMEQSRRDRDRGRRKRDNADPRFSYKRNRTRSFRGE